MHSGAKESSGGLYKILNQNSYLSIDDDFNLFDSLKGSYELNDLEDVQELIEAMYGMGCRPIVSVDAQDVDRILKKGLSPRVSWIKETGPIIVGTFGKPPYHPQNQNRAYLKLNVPLSLIRPRYTGPESNFAGIVYLGNRPIPPEQLELIQDGFQIVSGVRSKTSSIVNLH